MPEPLLESAAAESSPGKQKRGRRGRSWAGGAVVALAIAGVAAPAWRRAPLLIQNTEGTFSNDVNYLRATLKLSVLIVASGICAYVLVPWLEEATEFLRRHWRRGYTAVALGLVCSFQWAFVIHAGRWQFGGFDYSILIQEGWMQVLGKRPYVDFVASAPPFFDLGIKFAYQGLGVSWDAGLYLAALFTCATFLWIYWLLRGLSLSRMASIAMAFAIECAAMLTLSFWWYNNTTLILAAILFLSTLVYLERPGSGAAQFSYVVGLALTALAKPNIAGVALLGCVALPAIMAERRLRTVVPVAGASALAVAILVLNRISVPAMLHAYRSVAGERGFGAFGFSHMDDYEQYTSLCWIPMLCLPLFALLPRIWTQLRERRWRGAGFSLFFFLGPVIAAYGVATNGELHQVECTVLLAAGAVVAFGMRLNRAKVVRIYIAFLVAAAAGDLYQGAQRLRVYGVGQHTFFEWQDNRNLIQSGFLKNMRVSSTLIGDERQIERAMGENPGPYWFGPRLDFNNAVFALPMAEHLPVWWHPGTAFARGDVAGLIQTWEGDRFQTLIFLKGDPKNDYIYYPPEFLDVMRRDYIADERYPFLTVYRRRAEDSSEIFPRHPGLIPLAAVDPARAGR